MNKVILMGRLTATPELKYTATSSVPVTSFTVAVDRRFQKAGEEKKADFISCVAWNKTAEFVTKYFSKGSKIAIVGSIETRSYEGTDGKKVYVTEVKAEEAYFGEGKRENSGAPTQGDGFYPIDDDDQLPF